MIEKDCYLTKEEEEEELEIWLLLGKDKIDWKKYEVIKKK
jgi:hypothetical protein